MGQWSLKLRSSILTLVITSILFVHIWSIRVAEVCVIVAGDFTNFLLEIVSMPPVKTAATVATSVLATETPLSMLSEVVGVPAVMAAVAVEPPLPTETVVTVIHCI